jgi:hypothetical protein
MKPAVPVNSFNVYPTIARKPNANRMDPKREPYWDWTPAVRNPNPAVPIYIPANIEVLKVFIIIQI